MSKMDPVEGKEYIVTDHCFWHEMTQAEQRAYNPYDKGRSPHTVMLVDAQTGTVVHLPSGSVVRVVNGKASRVKVHVA